MIKHWGRLQVIAMWACAFVCWEGSACAGQVNVAPGADVAALINAGSTDLVLTGDAVWNSSVEVTNAAKAGLKIDGQGNTITVSRSNISLLREFTLNSDISITNTIFDLSTTIASNDYLIGFRDNNRTAMMNLSGTTFTGFNRTADRGGSVLFAYGNSTITIDGGMAGVTFDSNRSEWDAGGAMAVSYADINFLGKVDFTNNWTGNYGGAIAVYDFKNNLVFHGDTTFTGNHSSVFGGAIDVWGGQATVAFNGPTVFDSNYVHYFPFTGNTTETPRHVNDQHARGGAINIGYISSSGTGASVTFNGPVTFSNNYVLSEGASANNRNAYGGAISVYGNGSKQNYRLYLNGPATFTGNYVYSQNGQGNGGAIFYDSDAAQISLSSGTRFQDNYASTYGGAIYLQAGTIDLNALTDDIVFQGNRHGASFDTNNQPITGSGTPNAIYLGTSGRLNFNASLGNTIHFYDPIASIANSTVTVTKTGDGEVVFHGVSGDRSYDSLIQANTTVSGGYFTLADGVRYGSETLYGTFRVGNSGTVRGGGGSAVRAQTLIVESGGAIGATGGDFTLNAGSITLQNGARLTGFGSLNATADLALSGTLTADIASSTLAVLRPMTGASGSLIKTGAGTLSMGIANTYAGSTTVNAGILTATVNNALAQSSSLTVNAGGQFALGTTNQLVRNLAGAGTVNLGTGIFTVNSLQASEFSGAISGTGSVVKTGTADLRFSGSSTYSGGTTINQGRLLAGSGTALGTGAVAIAAGATLGLDIVTDVSFANQLTGTGSLEKTGGGTTTLTNSSSSVGAVTVRGGALGFDLSGGAFSANSYQTLGGAQTILSGDSQLNVAGSFTQAVDSTLSVEVGTNEPAIRANTAQLSGVLNVTGFQGGSFTRADELFNTFVVIETTLGITGDFARLNLGQSSNPVDYLYLDGRVTADRLRYEIGAGLMWYAAPDIAQGTFTLTESTDAFEVNRVLADRTETITSGWTGKDLIKQGLGTLTLSEVNTYTGSTDVRQGTLRLTTNSAIADSSAVSVAGGARVETGATAQTLRNLSGAGTLAAEAGGAITLDNTQESIFSGTLSGAASVEKTGEGTLVLGGPNSHASTAITAGRLVATGAQSLGAGQTTIASGATLELGLTANGTVANVLTGAGSVEKTGTRTVSLTAAGSSVGAMRVAAGRLNYSQSGIFSATSHTTESGASVGLAAGSRLAVSGAFAQRDGSALNVNLGSGTAAKITAGSVTLGGTLTVSGYVASNANSASSLAAGDRIVIASTGGAIQNNFQTVNLTGASSPADYLSLSGRIDESGNNYIISTGLNWYADPSTAGGTFTIATGQTFDVDVALNNRTETITSGWNGRDLLKYGTGVLILSGNNSYTGLTRVAAGTLRAGALNVFSDSSSVEVAAGATLDLAGFNQIANNLSGAGRITLGAAELRANTAGTATSVFSGNISGSGTLRKTGTGTLWLEGTSQYTGGTSISAGTLVAAGTQALGTGVVTTAAAGKLQLDYTGEIAFANQLAGSGSLEKTGSGTAILSAAGSSIGNVTVSAGELSLQQTGVFSATNYETLAGATTAIGPDAQLGGGSGRIQNDNSILDISVGTNDPAIVAQTARIGGALYVEGYESGIFTRAGDVHGETFDVIRSQSVIQGDFSSVNVGTAESPVDYLVVTGQKTNNDRDYTIGLTLKWLADPAIASGTFTLVRPSDHFEVDMALTDRLDPITSGWDGKSLVKAGAGTLILGANNTYTGSTSITAGTLRTLVDNAFASSSSVSVASGALLDTNGTNQRANNLTGAGTIALGAGTLTVQSTTNTIFTGNISGSGSLVKNGTSTLVLGGGGGYSGGVAINAGTLVATNNSALGTGTATVGNNATLELNLANTARIANELTGAGTVRKTGLGTARLTNTSSSFGFMDVVQGGISYEQAGVATVTGSHTTRTGASTNISSASQLEVGGAFIQQIGSTLSVAIGLSNEPAVDALSANLGGTLNVSGFNPTDFGRAGDFVNKRFIVIRTSNGISNDFDQFTIGTISDPVDYLYATGGIEGDNYVVGLGLRWFAGPDQGNGTFTIANPTDAFDINVVLSNQPGPFASGWNGRDLTKLGNGTLTLSEVNTYTGKTTVAAGTLATAVANAFADSESVEVQQGATLSLNNNSQTARNLSGGGRIELGTVATSTLTVNNTASSTFSGIIAGAGRLIKDGAGVFQLSGRNTFSGGTTVENGRLIAQGISTLGTGTVSVSNNGTLELNAATNSTLTNRLEGTGAFEKTGAGTVVLNNAVSMGATTLRQGGLTFTRSGAFAADSYTAANGTTTTLSGRSSLEIDQAYTQQGNAVLNVAIGSNSPAITADSASISGTLNITGFSAVIPARASELAANRFIVIDTANGITNDFQQLNIDGSVSRALGSRAVAQSPVDYLVVDGGKSADNKQYTVGLDLAWTAAGDLASGTFTLADPADAFNVDVALGNRTANANWNGRDLTKKGNGSLTLSAVNSYTGRTSIESGTLITGTNNAIARSSSVSIATGAALNMAGYDQTLRNLSGSGSIALGGGNLTLNNTSGTTYGGSISGNGALTKTGTGELRLSGNNTYVGNTAIQGGRLVAVGPQALGNGGVAISSGATLEFNLDTDAVITSVTSGTGTVEKTGSGKATLNNAGSSAGNVIVSSGEVAFAQPGDYVVYENYTTKAGATTSLSPTSTLKVGDTFTQEAGSVLGVEIGPANEPTIEAEKAIIAGSLNVTGFGSTMMRSSVLNNARFDVIKSTETIQGNFNRVVVGTDERPLDFLVAGGQISADGHIYSVGIGLRWYAPASQGDGVFNLADIRDEFTVDSVLYDRSGPFASRWNGRDLTKNGNGTLVLAAVNTYTGKTIVNAGTLATTVSNAFADSSEVILAEGSSLVLNATSQVANNLSGSGRIDLGTGALNAVISAGLENSFSGDITGSGTLRKSGSGALVLSGNNTYMGGTSVDAGRLVIAGANALGKGLTGIDSGATLELDIASDGTLDNTFNGTGALEKTGSGALSLTGTGSMVGQVSVLAGELAFSQDGIFQADSLTTSAGATTRVDAGASLSLLGALTQSAGSSLAVAVNRPTVQPAITANSAQLAGDLRISEFDPTLPASALTATRHTVLSTTGGITGDFDSVDFGGILSGVDYLLLDGSKEGDDYTVGFRMAWLAGANEAHGTFTMLDQQNVFDVDIALNDRTGTFQSGWNGKDLTKIGAGTLILSAVNGYTGETLIQGGVLATGVNNAFANSSQVTLSDGAVLDLRGYDQIANNLNGSGNVNLGAGRLTVNTSRAGVFSGAFSGTGTLIKTGAEVLTLTGTNSQVGAVDVMDGTLALQQAGAFRTNDFTIDSGAIVDMAGNSTLLASGAFAMRSGSSLIVDASTSTGPAIRAASAMLDGELTVGGYRNDAITKASQLDAMRFIVISSDTAIQGDFSKINVDFSGQQVDYLIGSAQKSADQLTYSVGMSLRWYGNTNEGNGVFTLPGADDVFEVDVELTDRSDGYFVSGWDGNTLTKNGAGTLILSKTNSYGGTTRVNAGLLSLQANDALGRGDQISVGAGGTVAFGTSAQTIGQLNTESGALVNLDTGSLTITSSLRDSTSGSGGTLASETVTGAGALNVDSSILYVRGTNSGYSGNVLASGGSELHLENGAGLGQTGSVTLESATDILRFGTVTPTRALATLPDSFTKDLIGSGVVMTRDSKQIAILGQISHFNGLFVSGSGTAMGFFRAENLGTAAVTAEGTMVVAGDSAWYLGNTVTGSGRFVKSAGNQVVIDQALVGFVGDSVVEEGALIVGNQTMPGAVLGGRSVTVEQNGVLSGIGTVTAPVTNTGVVAALNSLAGYEQVGPTNFTTASMTNSGNIRLAGTSIGNTLTVVGGYAGAGGTLELNTIFGSDNSPTDRLILDGGTATGATGLIVHRRGSGGNGTDIGILVVDARNGAITANTAFTLSSGSPSYRGGIGTLAVGAFDYSLVKGGNGGDPESWYLVMGDAVRPEAGVYLANFEAAENMFSHTMHDRLLGYEMKIHPETGRRILGRAWARVMGNSSKLYSDSGNLSSRTNSYGIHTGIDIVQRDNAGFGSLHAGFMMGMGTARNRTQSSVGAGLSAKGKLDGYAVGLYGTWFANTDTRKGAYIDTWVQHAWFRNSTFGGGVAEEKYNTRRWSGSVETGYNFVLQEAENSLWTLGPVFQATYGKLSGTTFAETGETEIRFLDNAKLATRLGLRLQGHIDHGAGKPYAPYAEVNWQHRNHSSRLSMDGYVIYADSPKNQAEIKIGIEKQLWKARLAAEAFARLGENKSRSYGGQLGVSYEW